jgi:sulfate transport system substrate-binding protein
MRRRENAVAFVVAAFALGLATGCGSGADSGTDVIRLGAYSVVREAFHDRLIPDFQERWKAKTGRSVRFEESYNASGAQARAIASGFDADVAVLSHSGDMEILVQAGRVSAEWSANPLKGIVTNSVVVIGHRDGNPKAISDWSDLAKPGVGVLYPDPKTSGGARWNINAIYGAAFLKEKAAGGDTPDLEVVRDLMARVQANVVNMDASGRQSMATFSERGIGDAVVTYENEILLRKREGKPIAYVVPESTLLIESPAALVESSVERHKNREVAAEFLAFLESPEGQAMLADYGFRPVDPEQAAKVGFPRPAKLFTMADLGGWERVQDALYGPKGLWTSLFSGRGGK